MYFDYDWKQNDCVLFRQVKLVILFYWIISKLEKKIICWEDWVSKRH